MNDIISRPDPADGPAVWRIEPDQHIAPRWRYVLLAIFLLIPMTVTATLGTISFSGDDGTAVASFWPAAAFQVVFSIWFGVYGAAVGVFGTMLGNAIVGQSPWMYLVANIFQASLPGLYFRWRKLDPRLRTWRDWFGAIVVGCVLSQIVGAAIGMIELHLRGFASQETWQTFASWVGGNALPCLLLVPAMLKSASEMIVREPMFCPSFWGGPARSYFHGRRWPRFADLSIMVKLMSLVVVAGVLPLSTVAALSVWTTQRQSEVLAVEANRNTARELRNEIERHELLLETWASQLNKVGNNPQQREVLLQRFRAEPQGFADLAIVPAKALLQEDSSALAAQLNRSGPGFYVWKKPQQETELIGFAWLSPQHAEALVGVVVWRSDMPMMTRWELFEAMRVVGPDGRVLYWNGPESLAKWQPAEPNQPLGDKTIAYQIHYDGTEWYVAETQLPRLGWRFYVLAPAKKSQAVVRRLDVPNELAALINLAIFGSLIAGSAIAKRISRRVLTIAENVREKGSTPGELNIPIRGRDELGYLGQTLNRISAFLAENIRRLQVMTAEKERLAAEMDLARKVQQSILPKNPPQVSGYDFAATCRPAREVGGDFYDFISDVADGHTVLMIGDAAGKGLHAAMFITEAHGLAHAAAMDHATPDRILTTINAAMTQTHQESDNFVTLLCTRLDPKSHRLTYASAGHNPAILLHDGQTRRFELDGLPLAVMPESHYTLKQCELADGDTVVMYTDGVTEAANAKRELFGMKRLEDVVRAHADASAQEMMQAILDAVAAFVGREPPSDDLTLLILKRQA